MQSTVFRSGAPPPRAVALAWTGVTGFCGLVDEVVWQRALATLLGSHGEATAAVLAIFLGGLAAGYELFGRLCRRHPEWRPRDLLRRYAAAEAAIGLHALAFPFLFSLAGRLSSALPEGGFGLDLLLCTALLAPPTILMGATVPLLTEALSRDAEDATRLHAFVYGWNTLGAFLGALCAGFLLLPALGIPGTLRVTAALNLAAAAAFWTAARRMGPRPRAMAPPPAAASAPISREAAAAFCLGFALMALQTVTVRIAGLAFGASNTTFAVVVATFVLCIALGSLAVAGLRRVPEHAAAVGAAALGALLACLHPWIDQASFAAHRIRVLLPDDATGFLAFQAAMAGLILATLALPLAVSGALPPLLFHDLRRRRGELGAAAGRLYAWNTVGSVGGALLGGYALLYIFDLHHVYRLAVALVALAALLLAGRLGRAFRAAVGAVALATLLAAWMLPRWAPERLSTAHLRLRGGDETVLPDADALASYHHGGGVLYATDDPTTTLLVNEHEMEGGGTSRALFTNGKSDGSLFPDYPTMALAGLVPCLLAERCGSAFVIGLGTGVTAGELAAVETMERVTVAEISDAVVAALPLFAEGNRAVHESPKLEIVRADAYRALLRRQARFDVIVSEPSHPWASGVENLYAVEFLTAARERLAPGGVYAQWMHAYEMDDATLALVLRSYAAAFPRTAVWFASGPDLLLLGFPDEGASDLEVLAERFARPDLAAGLARAGIHSLPVLLAHELVPPGALAPHMPPGPLHTLMHPRLAHAAAAAFHRDDRARLPRVALERRPTSRSGAEVPKGLLSRLEATGGLDEAALEAVVRRVCGTREWECTTLLAWWQSLHPGSPRVDAVRSELEARLEPHLLEARIALLAALFAEGWSEPLDAESAQRVLDHYRAYYHYAVPFRRAALERTLARCEGAACPTLPEAPGPATPPARPGPSDASPPGA